MTFEEALVAYQDSRTKTREALSEVHRLENQYLALGKELAQSKRRYNVVRRVLQRTQDVLIPELRKEVDSHQLLDPIKNPDELPVTEAEGVELVKDAIGQEGLLESQEKNADSQPKAV